MDPEKEIIQRINNAIAEEFEINPDGLTPEATLFDDLGLDSLDAVDMVVVLEKEFGMKLSNEEAVRAVRTMGDLHNLILRLRNNSTD